MSSNNGDSMISFSDRSFLCLFQVVIVNKTERVISMLLLQWIDGLRSWSFFLFTKQCPQGNVGNLDNFEAHTRNITDGVTLSTETSD